MTNDTRDQAVWNPRTWMGFPNARPMPFSDGAAMQVVEQIRTLPPLVNSYEVELLREELAAVEDGQKFVLQGGDCAETLRECRSDMITRKVKILMQMSVVLASGIGKPVVRVGRIAGQYAKPRSSSVEKRHDEAGRISELPSYFGDSVNSAAFSEAARRPNPGRMFDAYTHAAMTLNFIRSLTTSEFADPSHAEDWALHLENVHLDEQIRQRYEALRARIVASANYALAAGWTPKQNPAFYSSHEGLNLFYEMAQTRRVPRRENYYCLTTHLPWIGARTNQLDGAHIEFFRGIRNPIGVKVGPNIESDELLKISEALNPDNEKGRLILISRLGDEHVEHVLPRLLETTLKHKRNLVWLCDPMHGNTRTTGAGHKTRDFSSILAELETSVAIHKKVGSSLGGVHFELTGEDVTECVGGLANIREENLSENYVSVCDPRLNYAQSLEMAMHLADAIGV